MRTKAHENWYIFKNPFLTQTSYRTFYSLTSDHQSKLGNAQTDPQILPFWERYTPLHEAFVQAYTIWDELRGQLKGATQRVDNKQEKLIRLIGMWDVKIQTFFFHDTPEYQTILPKKRRPFQSGGRESRLAALNRFKEALSKFPSLSVLHTEVSNFYQVFLDLRDQQQQLAKQVHDASETVRKHHQIAADIMYRNLLGLISVLGLDYKVAGFFEIGLIRKNYSSTLLGTFATDETTDQQDNNDQKKNEEAKEEEQE